MENLNETVVEKSEMIALDVDSLINSFEKRLGSTESNIRREESPTIFRVPREIREVDGSAYEPVMVGLGPYNHAKSSLADMEGLKWRFLKKFLSRNCEKKLKDYIMEVEKLEQRARNAYNECPKMTSENFVEMMVLDCCFVIELLRLFSEDEHASSYEKRVIQEAKINDMLVAENQLPFFLLQALSTLNDPSFDVFGTAIRMVIPFPFVYSNIKDLFEKFRSGQQDVHHILHLFYVLLTKDIQEKHLKSDDYNSSNQPTCLQFLLRKTKNLFSNKKMEPVDTETIPCATKLREAGVKFKRNKTARSILDISFDDGVMHIPQLPIYDNIFTFLRNLVAFEQFFDGEKNQVASYVDFMDSLLDTVGDVEMLQEDEIIINCIGSNDAIAQQFNNICKGVSVNHSPLYLEPVCVDVKKYARKMATKVKP